MLILPAESDLLEHFQLSETQQRTVVHTRFYCIARRVAKKRLQVLQDHPTTAVFFNVIANDAKTGTFGAGNRRKTRSPQ